MTPKVIIATRLFPPRAQRLLHLLVSQSSSISLGTQEEGEGEGTTTGSSYELIQNERDSTCSRDWLKEQIAKDNVVAILGTLGDRFDEDLLSYASPNLQIISTMSAGYDHVDVQALKKRGIKLGTTPDALTDATADIGAMLTLMTTRRAGEAYRKVLQGDWPQLPWSPFLLCGSGIQNKTIGIIGFGRIGQLLLRRLVAFSPSSALYLTSQPGTPPKRDYYNLLSPNSKAYHGVAIEPANSLEDLARRSEIVVVCCSLTKQTEGLINDEFFDWMAQGPLDSGSDSASGIEYEDYCGWKVPSSSSTTTTCTSSPPHDLDIKPKKKGHNLGGYLINIARGPIVSNSALLSALSSDKLSGAGLDVISGEPLIGSTHPLVQDERVIVLPHIGSATIETRERMAEDAVRNLFAGLGVDKVKGDWDQAWKGEWRNQIEV